MNIQLENKNVNMAYQDIIIYSLPLTSVSTFELYIILNGIYNVWRNNIFMSHIDIFLVCVFILTHFTIQFYSKIVVEKNRDEFILKSSHLYKYTIFLIVPHIVFLYVFCKYLINYFTFNLSPSTIISFLYFYHTTLICLFTRIIMVLTRERHHIIQINSTFQTYHIFIFISAVLLFVRCLCLKFGISYIDFLVPNFLMLLYYSTLIQNIYMMTDSKTNPFKMIYIIIIAFIFIPTVTHTFGSINLFI